MYETTFQFRTHHLSLYKRTRCCHTPASTNKQIQVGPKEPRNYRLELLLYFICWLWQHGFDDGPLDRALVEHNTPGWRYSLLWDILMSFCMGPCPSPYSGSCLRKAIRSRAWANRQGCEPQDKESEKGADARGSSVPRKATYEGEAPKDCQVQHGATTGLPGKIDAVI